MTIVKGIDRGLYSSVPTLARWRVRYLGRSERAFRTIHILRLHPRSSAVDAFCELRMAVRVFNFCWMESAYDLQSGECVNPRAWANAYITRQQKAAAQTIGDQTLEQPEAAKYRGL
jgi:hypothetical protein